MVTYENNAVKAISACFKSPKSVFYFGKKHI